MSGRAEAAEAALRELGYACRVRADGHDATIATITVHPDRWAELSGPAARSVAERVRALGFRYVALDLAEPDDPGA